MNTCICTYWSFANKVPLLIVCARSIQPIFVILGFVARKDGTVLTIKIVSHVVIGLSSMPLGEVPRVAVSPLPISLFFVICCSNPHKFWILVLQHMSYVRSIRQSIIFPKGWLTRQLWMNFRKTSKCPRFGKLCYAFLQQTFRIRATPPFSENSSFSPLKITEKTATNFFG